MIRVAQARITVFEETSDATHSVLSHTEGEESHLQKAAQVLGCSSHQISDASTVCGGGLLSHKASIPFVSIVTSLILLLGLALGLIVNLNSLSLSAFSQAFKFACSKDEK